jgi:hypothetical protein
MEEGLSANNSTNEFAYLENNLNIQIISFKIEIRNIKVKQTMSELKTF